MLLRSSQLVPRFLRGSVEKYFDAFVTWLKASDRPPLTAFPKMMKLNYPKPWMLKREVEFLDEWMNKNRPKRILEWGSGGSTVYFAGFYDFIERWLAIEHDHEWYQKVRQDASSVVTLKLCNMSEYVEMPEGRFDIILVDGRRRVECLNRVGDLLKEDGICFLHDSDRDIYKPYPSDLVYEKVMGGNGSSDGLTMFWRC